MMKRNLRSRVAALIGEQAQTPHAIEAFARRLMTDSWVESRAALNCSVSIANERSERVSR